MVGYQEQINKIIENALIEDDYKNDHTSSILIEKRININCSVITKTKGVVSGVEIACLVYQHINPKIKIKILKESGSFVNRGDVIFAIEGPAKDILRGERVVENFLQRMSSIASLTFEYVNELKGTKTKILDTRNTTPGLRILEKRAVVDGGGYNDLNNLSERFVITHNHLMLNPNVIEVVDKLKNNKIHEDLLVQIEVDNRSDFLDALNSKADIIVITEANIDNILEYIKINDSLKTLVARGNFSLSNARTLAVAGIDYIALDNITANIKPLDISIKFYKNN